MPAALKISVSAPPQRREVSDSVRLTSPAEASKCMNVSANAGARFSSEHQVVPRKGPAVAATCTQTILRAENNPKKMGRTRGQASESRTFKSGNWVTEKDRDVVKLHLFRLSGKYDPRAIPRIISKRTGMTEQAVDQILQALVREYEDWSREIRSAIVRADESVARSWKAGAA